jgi:hypothetical protein
MTRQIRRPGQARRAPIAFRERVPADDIGGARDPPRFDGGPDAVVRVGDDKLDPLSPRRRSLRRNSVQKVSASDGPTHVLDDEKATDFAT